MSDIYQSPGDRLRFEVLLKSLTEGNLNIAVLSKHDKVLDYYGKLFEERLLSKGEEHVEFCTSTNSEHLVQKFNEILSQVSLDEALEKEVKHAPRRYLIFRDSVLMQDFEIQLLARLVNGFPAGNISVILLINHAGNYKSKVAAFGKNLLEWEVETQAGEAKEPLTDWVREEPVLEPEPPVPLNVPTLDDPVVEPSKLLNMPAKTAWRIPGFGKKKEAVEPEPVLAAPAALASSPPMELPVAPAPIPPMPDVLREPTLSHAQAVEPSVTTPNFAKPESKKSYAGWILLVMLLSLAAFGVLYQDLIADEAEKLKKYVLRGTPAAPAPNEVSSAASSAAIAASQAASVASEAVVVGDKIEAASSASASMPEVKQSPASSPVAEVASMPKAAASAPVLAPPPVVEKTQDQNKATAKEVDVRSDDQWVAQLASGSYVLQLSAMDTEEEMRAFKRSNPVYAKARIMQAPKKGSNKRYFILVVGPFDSKSEADAYMQTSPLLAKGWLRTAKSMKTQFGKS
jgi:septal ring-binding cell division protein DamX